jgi:hypothetical protein
MSAGIGDTSESATGWAAGGNARAAFGSTSGVSPPAEAGASLCGIPARSCGAVFARALRRETEAARRNLRFSLERVGPGSGPGAGLWRRRTGAEAGAGAGCGAVALARGLATRRGAFARGFAARRGCSSSSSVREAMYLFTRARARAESMVGRLGACTLKVLVRRFFRNHRSYSSKSLRAYMCSDSGHCHRTYA